MALETHRNGTRNKAKPADETSAGFAYLHEIHSTGATG